MRLFKCAINPAHFRLHSSRAAGAAEKSSSFSAPPQPVDDIDRHGRLSEARRRRAMKPNAVSCGSSFASVPKEEQEEWESHLNEARSGNFERQTLSKQTSMRETRMELKWEKRRRQARQRVVVEAKEAAAAAEGDEKKGIIGVKSLTDEDMDELRGSIELGFGFVEEEGGNDLRDTLPALNLYFAVNRQLSDKKLPIPSTSSAPTSSVTSSAVTRNPNAQPSQKAAAASSDAWLICNPGDNPQFVKARLRHWAQAVACSMRQSC